MVRQIALEFAYRRQAKKIAPDKEGIDLALAFALAETNRKGKTKIRQLSKISMPFWVVQISDSNSILLSASEEFSMEFNLSEDQTLGPIRRIINNETSSFEDIPHAIDRALTLLEEVEAKVYDVRNLLEPDMFVKQGENMLDIEPGSRLYIPDLKVNAQKALTISQEFQSLLENAETRLRNMKDLQHLTMEKLTDRLNALDNVITSEIARWQRRCETAERTTELEIENLKERLSDKNYKLKEKRKKNEQKLVSDFARTTADLERFFVTLLEDIRNTRTELSSKEINAEEAVERYGTMVSVLDQKIDDYRGLVMSTNDVADGILQASLALDEELSSVILQEEKMTDCRIEELHAKLKEMEEEMNSKTEELNALKSKVTDAVAKIDSAINKRVEALQIELKNLRALALGNDSIKGLAPLTQLNVSTYIVNYNKGNPLVLTPILVPEDRFGLPFDPEPLSAKIRKFITGSVKNQLKDSASFKASLKKTCTAGNVFQFRDQTTLFTKGIDSLWNRQLLKEGVREALKDAYLTLAGRCPKCKAEISAEDRFCPACGAGLG